MYNTWKQVRGKGDMKLGRDKEKWGKEEGERGGKTIHGNRKKSQGDMNWEGGRKGSRRKPKPEHNSNT